MREKKPALLFVSVSSETTESLDGKIRTYLADGFWIGEITLKSLFSNIDVIEDYSAVIILSHPHQGHELFPLYRKVVDRLLRYVEAGGGLFVFNNPTSSGQQALLEAINSWLFPLGAEFQRKTLPRINPVVHPGYGYVFDVTRKIVLHPATSGTKKICYPVMAQDIYATSPLKITGRSWEPLVYSADGKQTLAAARRYGKGRIIAFSSYSNIWLTDPFHPLFGGYVYNRGDAYRFLDKSFAWASGDKAVSEPLALGLSEEPSAVAGRLEIKKKVIGTVKEQNGRWKGRDFTFLYLLPAGRWRVSLFFDAEGDKEVWVQDNCLSAPAEILSCEVVCPDGELRIKFSSLVNLKTVRAWQNPDYPFLEDSPGTKPESVNVYNGIIGVHSALTDGKDSIEEFCRVAKELAYDYIVFTEEHSLLTSDSWEDLKHRCRKCSDETFTAIPGFEFSDGSGNKAVAFAHELWVTREQIKSINGGFTWVFFERGWPLPPLAVIETESNPYRFSQIKFFNSLAVFYYDGPDLKEENLDWYIWAESNYYNLNPISFQRIKDVDQLRLFNGFTTRIVAENRRGITDAFKDTKKKCFVSKRLLPLRYDIFGDGFKVRERYFEYFYLWQGGDHLRLEVELESKAKIKLYKKDRIAAENEGRKLVYEEKIWEDGPFFFIAEKDDDKLISPSILTRNYLFRNQMCADKQNTISTVYRPYSSEGPCKMTSSQTIGEPFDRFYSNVPYAAPKTFDTAIPPLELFTAPRLLLKNGLQLCFYPERSRVYASTEVSIDRNRYFLEAPFEWYNEKISYDYYKKAIEDGQHLWYVKREERRSASPLFQAQVDYITFNPSGAGGAHFILFNYSLSAREKLEFSPEAALPLVIMQPSFYSTDHYGKVCSFDGAHEKVSDRIEKSISLPKGGYVGFYPSCWGGVSIYNLQDEKLQVEIMPGFHLAALGMKPAFLEKGATVKVDLLVFIGDGASDDKTFKNIARAYGISGKPAYRYKTEGAKTLSHAFALELQPLQDEIMIDISDSFLPTPVPVILNSASPVVIDGFKRLNPYDGRIYFYLSTGRHCIKIEQDSYSNRTEKRRGQ